MNAIPVVNENDTISADEIKFGDNDALSVLVTNLLNAELLIILSADGLYDRFQRQKQGNGYSYAENIFAKLSNWHLIQRPQGVAHAKLEAASVVTNAGEAVIIANGRMDNVLKRIAGENIGTLFLPKEAS